MLTQPRIRVGDTLESAIWLTGTEPPALIAHHKAQVEAAILEANGRNGVVTGPLRWVEKLPGTDRVPPVPDHIAGPAVRLLVAEADVLNVLATESRFLAELEPSDLRRLRKITRDAHRLWWQRNMPGRPYTRPTDNQCATLINDLGPDCALEALQKGWTRLAGDGQETVH
jgi:hypothetical protein